MAVHIIETFFPEVEEQEVADLLERELGSAGYHVEERLTLDKDLHPAINRHRGAGAFVLSTRPGDYRPPATLLTTVPALDRRWDPALVRTLSRGVGGYAVALDARRTRGEYGLGVFYAGRTIDFEQISWERAGDEGRVNAGFLWHWKQLADGVDFELNRPSTVRPQIWIVRDLRPPGPPRVPDPRSEPVFGRAAFGPLDDEMAFREAFAQLVPSPRPSLRWLARATYHTAFPFAVLDCDGLLDDTLVIELARRLDTFFAAVEFSGPGRAFRWTGGHGNGTAVKSGVGAGAADLEKVWGRFSVCMGASPSCVRWPRQTASPAAGLHHHVHPTS